MGLLYQIKPKTKQALLESATPQNPNQPEVIPWILYDTQTYTSASSTTLAFFQSVQTDKSLGNMEGAGQLPDPQFFEIYRIGMDILFRPSFSTATVNPATGPLDDIAQLVLSGRGNFILAISNKNYGPFPLSFLHGSGGPTGFMSGTYVATNEREYANNGIFDGGYPLNGALVLPPKVGFSIVINWPAALTLANGNTPIRVWMAGPLYRRVL